MTVTLVVDGSIGVGITAAATAATSASAVVAATVPTFEGQLAGYVLLNTPAPSFDITAQLGVAVDALATASAALSLEPGGPALVAALDLAMAAQVAALAAIRAAYPAMAVSFESAVAAIGALNAAISAGIVGPNIDLVTVGLKITELGAIVAGLEAQADIAADITANLSVGGLRVIRFDGDISLAGAELGAYLSGSGLSGDAHFVLMLPTTDACWVGLQATIAT
jgi:hypothetical protein